MAASGALPAEQSTIVRVSATETGLYALLTEGGLGSLAVSTTGRALMAVGRPFRFEDPTPRLYFHVPKGTREFTITTGGMDAKLHMTIMDASG